MPRGLAAAYRMPWRRATALTRPSDQAGRTLTRWPRRLDHGSADPRLDVEHTGLRLARVERGRHVRGVERREVDRLLQVHAERQVVEEEQQRPLILLVAAGRAERQVRLAVPQREARGERRARPLARRERGGQP